MKKPWCCQNIHVDPNVAMSVGFSQYHFSTPEIRLLMRHVLGHALSGLTIKRVLRSAGLRLKRGRPRTTPRVQKKCVNDLIGATSEGLGVFDGNALHFLNHIEVQFGLSPRQYLKWITQSVRRGKCMVRKCLLCGDSFPSMDSGERHCQSCKINRNRLIRKDEQSMFSKG